MIQRQLTFTLFFILIFFTLGYSQATCLTAVPVTLGVTQCGSSQGQAGDFPNAGGAPINPCVSFYNDDEYWFSIVGDGVNALQINLTNITQTYAGVFVLDNCPANGPNCVNSIDNGSSTANLSLKTFTPLANGVTYYIVIANWGTPDWTDFCLDVTLTPPPTAPTNDECADAIMLTPNPNLTCTNLASGSTDSTTMSMPGCIGTANNDVWFSFVATNTVHSVDLLNIVPINGTSIDMVHEVFSGGCGALTSISCSDPDVSTITGLTIGTTYLVRVYSYFNSNNQLFDICIKTPPPPPTNDECLNALKITPNPNDSCGIFLSGATATASQSQTGCIGTANDDVWYSFDATSTEHTVELLNVVATSGNSVDMVHEVFAGTCGGLMSLSCSDPDASTVTSLTIGSTYFVRVYSYFSSSSQTFDLCIKTPAPPPPPPTNDNCLSSDTLNVQMGSCSTWTVSTNASTTDSGALPLPSCGSYNGGDLWFEVTVPASGNVVFDVQNVTWSNASSTLYSGTCGALVEENCVAFNNEWPIVYTGTPGIYYLRVYDYSNDNVGTFEICAFEPVACVISSVSPGPQTICDSTNGTYTQELIINHTATNGNMDINGQQFPVDVSPQTVILTGLVADGLPVTVTVDIVGTGPCATTLPDLFTSPPACFSFPTQNCGVYTNSPGLAIDDNITVTDTISVSTGMVLSKLGVVVQIDHSFLGDLNIYLTGPTSTTVELMIDTCGFNDDLEIQFEDQASSVICGTPTIGLFRPRGNLSDFIGQAFDGDWVLTIFDDAGGDQGTLLQWCLLPDLLLTTEEEKEQTASNLQLYPNPVSDILTIESDLTLQELEIWTMDGKKIKQQALNDFNSNVELNVHNLSPGMYVLRLRSDSQTIEKRFIKL